MGHKWGFPMDHHGSPSWLVAGMFGMFGMENPMQMDDLEAHFRKPPNDLEPVLMEEHITPSGSIMSGTSTIYSSMVS